MKKRLYIISQCVLLLMFSSLTNYAGAQTGKVWPSAIGYQLKGKVRSWTMKNKDGILRQQSFSDKGVLIKDSYTGTPQTYTAPEDLPGKLKSIYEATYIDSPEIQDSNSTKLFSEKGRLVKKKTPCYYETNKFTAAGNILVHKQVESITQTRAWNSPSHAEATYSFTDTVGQVCIYKYNAFGLMKEFELYHSDPFKNLRMVYYYDSANQLVGSERYDWYNIPSKLMSDHYLAKLMDTDIDSNFSINDFYNDYWSQGIPVKETWRYNSKGKKIEYIAGYLKEPGFRATWEYDDAGNLLKEIQYDVYHNSIRSVIEFDKQGNAIKETDSDFWNKQDNNFYYEVDYY